VLKAFSECEGVSGAQRVLWSSNGTCSLPPLITLFVPHLFSLTVPGQGPQEHDWYSKRSEGCQ
jgi:hypothetical protein